MDENLLDSPELQMLRFNKESGFNYRKRRQDEWTENYTLYRDRVIVNRLTQRQSVNVPLMKETIRTLLKDVDDMPVLYFENLDNDKEAEVFQNEYWKWTVEKNKMEIKDVIDKKQDFFFGRTFDQMQIVDGMVKFTIIDPEDILVDRYMDPSDIDSARFLIHTHIFVPLSKLELNEEYDQEKVKELKTWYASEQGLIKSKSNMDSLERKNQKLSDLGLEDVENPVLGETYVELSLHFVYRDSEASEDGTAHEAQLWLYVEADDMNILLKKPLEKVIGVTKDHYWRTHLPYNTWADDIDLQDFWTDGIADIVRTPNKVANAWYSQMVENRTLKNLSMNYYDSSLEGFNPQTYEPKAWGWYGIPVPQGGKIQDVVQRVDVPDLGDSLEEMNFVMNMVERATGATGTQQGVQEQKQVTLGEIKLALNEAKQRIKGMSKFYTQVWKDRAEKFLKLIEAAPEKLDAVTIYKKGRNSGDIYTRDIEPTDWMTKSGYTTRIWSQDEKDSQDTNELEKLTAIRSIIPNNPKLDEIVQRKALEFADIKPEDVNTIMEIEQQRRDAMAAMLTTPMMNGMGGEMPQGGAQGQQLTAPVPGQLPPPQA